MAPTRISAPFWARTSVFDTSRESALDFDERSTVKNFLRENWLYITIPFVIMLIVIVVLIFSNRVDTGTIYTIQ